MLINGLVHIKYQDGLFKGSFLLQEGKPTYWAREGRREKVLNSKIIHLIFNRNVSVAEKDLGTFRLFLKRNELR